MESLNLIEGINVYNKVALGDCGLQLQVCLQPVRNMRLEAKE